MTDYLDPEANDYSLIIGYPVVDTRIAGVLIEPWFRVPDEFNVIKTGWGDNHYTCPTGVTQTFPNYVCDECGDG